jgi:uncharacterized damage-inducible protein DinB
MTMMAQPVAGPLGVIFTVNNNFISRSIEGLTDDELWYRPTEQTNPMYWLLGHIVHTRGALLRIMGDEYRTGWGDRFQRGAVLRERAEYPALAEIERVRQETSDRLAARLATMTEAELAQEATGHQLPASKTVGDQIAFLGLHEAYHVGQLAYVRKMLGHRGIIG